MPTLLLVDASSYLYRAFHALPDLRNRAGEPTGAIYGVLNMLRRLHKDNPSDYSACVFDAKGKTFRDAIYPAYKANRPPMPDDLGCQIAPLHECIRAMGWPLLEIEGVEADDVIATLAGQARAQGVRTLISSGDKDLTQLVDPLVTMVNTMSNETFDEAGVAAKFGVRPDQIVDYLTLIGDSVDNIPGVEKVGPKTAVKWLQQFGTLDGVLAHADDIGGVVGENLRKARDWLPTARELLRVKGDVGLPVGLAELAPRAAGQTAAGTAVRASRLSGLAERARRGADTGRTAPRARVRDDSDRRAARRLARPRRHGRAECAWTYRPPVRIRKRRGWWACHSRSSRTGLPTCRWLHRYAGAPEQLPFDAALARLKIWLEDAARAKVGQDLKYTMHVLANHGIALRGARHDTLLQSYVLESHRPHDLGNLAQRRLGVKILGYEELVGKGAGQIPFEQVSVEQATAYSAEAADITLQLHGAQYPLITSRRQARLHLRPDRDAGDAGALRSGTGRRAPRRCAAEPAEPGAGAAHARHRATCHRELRASRSTSTRPSRSRRCCSRRTSCRC